MPKKYENYGVDAGLPRFVDRRYALSMAPEVEDTPIASAHAHTQAILDLLQAAQDLVIAEGAVAQTLPNPPAPEGLRDAVAAAKARLATGRVRRDRDALAREVAHGRALLGKLVP